MSERYVVVGVLLSVSEREALRHYAKATKRTMAQVGGSMLATALNGADEPSDNLGELQ